MLNISLFELNTREQLPGVTRLAGSVDEAYDAMTSIVNELAARISGTPAGRPASSGGTPAGRPASGAAAPAGGNVEGSLLRAGNTIMKNLAPKSRLVIMYITAPDAEVSKFIADELEFLIVSKGFTLIEQSIMDRIRKGQSFQLSGELDDRQAVFIGNLVGANVIITGAVTGTGNSRRLRLRALSTKKGQVLAVASESY
jgi:hypothetical protein